jgi:HPt (histidine-containing phosphotransfer) domain-containing protein
MTDAFDWEGVLVLVDNDPEMALMMLQNFLESERGTFDKIVSEVRACSRRLSKHVLPCFIFPVSCLDQASKSADAVDWAALRKDSHSLKGSSSYLCLKQVTDIAYKMQRASEAKDKAQIDTLLEQLKVEFEIAFELLTNKLNELMSA